MTQEDKQLLLKDLCARLPYGVKVLYWHHKNGGAERRVGELTNVDLRLNCDELVFRTNQYYFESDSIATSKPYLRPLSSMTEEEEENLRKDTGLDIFKCTVNKELEDLWATDCSVKDLFCLYSWLNEHHFDYNGLIEKGLALEAPADMYKNG